MPYVLDVLVCDPRKNALIKSGNKSDRIDPRKLADLLYLDKLHPVFHGETGNRALKELARSYLALTRDTTRVMNRLKALYRSWAIPCAGQRVYALRYRSKWLAKITKECGWKDGDRGGPAQTKKTSDKKKKNRLDTYRPSYGWPSVQLTYGKALNDGCE
jgi:hypothetical protein